MDRRRFLQAGCGMLAAGMVKSYGLSALTTQSASAARTEHTGTPEISRTEFERTRQFVGTDFGNIAYVERGRGEAALFLHGFPLSSFQWRGALPRLARYRRCIAPDWLGLGDTEVVKGGSVTPKTQAEMLAQFLDKLGIKKIDIVANDSGGAVAQLFITRYPERVRTLLLTNCDAEPDSPPPAVLPVIELARAGKFADEWLAPWLADKALARSPKGIGGMCYSDPRHPTDDAIECYLGPLVSSPERRALTNAYAMGLDPNPLAGVEEKLKRCKAPVRIVWGMSDNIFAMESAGYLDNLFPQSRGVRRLPGEKLFFPEERPEVVTEEAMQLWGV